MSDKILIYGQRLSPFVERVYLHAQVKGLGDQVELVQTELANLKTPEYLALNPLGKMPTIKWGDFVFYESTLIMELLEESFPETPLLPEDPKERAAVRLFPRVLDLYYHTNTVGVFNQIRKETPNWKWIDYHISEASKAMNLIESRITGDKFLHGDRLTLADVTLFASVYIGKAISPHFGQVFFEDRPKMERWYEGLAKEPAFTDSNKARKPELDQYMQLLPLDKIKR